MNTSAEHNKQKSMEDEKEQIEASSAPLMSHLIELRGRLLKSVIVFFVLFILCFAFSTQIYNFLLEPYGWARGSISDVQIISTALQEYFFTRLRLAFLCALFLSFPVLATQIYRFMAPGLYNKEKKAFVPYLVATPALFFLGGLVVYYIIMPMMLLFFVAMEQIGTDSQASITQLTRVSEYLSLITSLIFGFGLCFQLPVVLTILANMGVVDSAWLSKQRRYAIVFSFVAAAILTPPDPFSQLAMALPTIGLYEISILAVRKVEKRRASQKQETEEEA